MVLACTCVCGGGGGYFLNEWGSTAPLIVTCNVNKQVRTSAPSPALQLFMTTEATGARTEASRATLSIKLY